MRKILKYTLFDLLRSRWTYLYFGFFLVFSSALLLLSGDSTKVIVSLMNVILILCPLIATMFGVMYCYNSREFTELLLAQPLPRRAIFWGQYLGVALSLSVSLLLGIGLPFLFFGLVQADSLLAFLFLLANGVVLSFIFSGLAFLIALRFDNKIRGFGMAILLWLFFAVIYDGLLLLLLFFFRDYPLENLSLGMSLFNPIDLSRILLLLQLDTSAIMGYTGAVFQKFLGTSLGILVALLTLGLWVLIPSLSMDRLAKRKDF